LSQAWLTDFDIAPKTWRSQRDFAPPPTDVSEFEKLLRVLDAFAIRPRDVIIKYRFEEVVS
jgi:nitroreductase